MPSNGTSNQFVVRDIPASVYANGVDGSAGNVISTANIAAINGAAQFTTEIWIKPVGTAKSSVIYDNSQAGVTDSFFLSMDANYSLFAYQTVGTLSKNITGTTARVIPGKWNLINVTYNGALISIFLNGSVIATLAASGTLGSNTGIFRIGSYHTGAFSLTFLGYIHRPRLYTLGMTLQEHQDRYYSDKTSAALQAALIMDLDTSIGGSGTTLTDLSGAGNTGTMGASASWATDSPFETGFSQREIRSSLAFNGSTTAVTMGDVFSPGTSDFTISTWFRTTNSQTLQALITKKTDLASTGAIGFSMFLELGRLRTASSDGTNLARRDTPTSLVVPNNTWCMGTVTYTASTGTLSVYFNGGLTQAAQFGTPPSGTLTTTEHLRFGSDNGARRYLSGGMSDAILWSRVLTATEIRKLYTDHIVPTSSFVDRWVLDEGITGAAVISQTGTRNGTTTSGSYTVDAPFKKGLLARHYESSLVFNGTSSALVKTTPTGINTGTSSRSVSGWIYLTSNAIQTIAQFKVNGSNQSPAFALGQISNIYYFAFDTINAGNNLTMTLAQFNAAFPLYKWLHVAYVMTTTNISLYVNGTLIISTNWGTVINSSAYDNLFLGKTQDGSNTNQYWFAGRMQDIRIHNAALTQAQIQDEYLDGELSSSIVSRFIGQEGAGTTVSDSVGTNHLTNTSVTWISDTPIKRGRDRSGNLVKNGDFDYVPVYTAKTNVNERWIDGTAGGSTTNNLFRWKLASTSLSGTVTSIGARFTTVAGRQCLEVDTVGGMRKSGSTVTGLGIFGTSYSGSTLTETDRSGLLPVLPNTTYMVSMDYFTTQLDAGIFPSLAVVEYDYSLTRGVTTSGSGGTDVSVDWRTRSFVVTTSATTRYVSVSARCQAGGGVDFDNGNCTIAFDKIFFAPVFPEGQVPANGNLVKNFDFEIAPSGGIATTTQSRWPDGTAGGSTTNATYKWKGQSGSNNTSILFDPTVSHSGSYSLKLSALDTAGSFYVDIGAGIASTQPVETLKSFAIPVTGGVSYTLTGWVKTNNVPTNGAFLQLTTYDSAGTRLDNVGSSVKLTGTQDWTQITIAQAINARAAWATIGLMKNVAGNISDAWFDDIYLGQ